MSTQPTPEKQLTPKQQQFILEYLKDLCGTAAAVRAGYAERSAKRIAYELLQKPEIRSAVDIAIDERSARTAITADQVLRDIARIAAKAEADGEYPAALRGRELLGKHLRLFTDKVELTGQNGGPVEFTEIRRTVVDPAAPAA